MAAWQTYEEVARNLLQEFAAHFGLGKVEGKQIVPGTSGTSWEIDAKAYSAAGDGFLLVECRRHLTVGPSQEQMAALCFRITDTGASSGILVSPHEPQKGAKLVASHTGVHYVQLRADSTTENYLLRFLNRVFVGVSDEAAIAVSDSAIVRVVRADGSTEEHEARREK